MIQIIPKKKIYLCDLCGKEVKDFGYKLGYKQWCELINPKPVWEYRELEICWDCWSNIESNLKKLAKENKDEK